MASMFDHVTPLQWTDCLTDHSAGGSPWCGSSSPRSSCPRCISDSKACTKPFSNQPYSSVVSRKSWSIDSEPGKKLENDNVSCVINYYHDCYYCVINSNLFDHSYVLF